MLWHRVPSLQDREFELLRREALDGVEAIKQHELRQRFFFEQTLSRLLLVAEYCNVLVIVEDVQWADPSTGSLIAFLVRAVALARAEGYPGKIAFCFTHRLGSNGSELSFLEVMLENQKHLEQAPVHLRLEPFSQEQSAQFVAALLMENLNSEIERFCQALFKDFSPTPLYVEQALRLLLYQGHLTQGRFDAQGRWVGQWNIDPDLAAQSQLPATVQDAIGERAARLSVQTQRLLAMASVEGRQFTVSLMVHASDRHLNEVLDSLDEAAQEGFILPVIEAEVAPAACASSSFYRFAHDRYREALYEKLEEGPRQDIHLRLAEAIVALAGANTETAESLARHYACGGKHAQAYSFAVMAGDTALKRGAFARAAELYGAAFAAAQGAGIDVEPILHGRYADACVATGDFEMAQQHYNVLIDLLPPGLERWDTQRRAAELNYRRRDFKNATAPLERLLGEMGHPVPRRDWRYTVSFFLGVLWQAPLLILISFARRFFSRPARHLARIGVLTRAWYTLTECYMFLDHRRCRYHAPRYAVFAYWAGDFPFRAAAISSMAYGSVTVGLWRASQLAFDWTQLLLRKNPDADASTIAHYLLLFTTFYRGETRMELIGPTLQAAEASGDIHRRFMARLICWVVLHFDGRTAASLALARSIGTLGERYGMPVYKAWGRYLEGIELQCEGEMANALELFHPAERILDQHGDLMGTIFSRVQMHYTTMLMPHSPTEETLREVATKALELTSTLLSRRLLGSSEHSWSLAAAGLALLRLEIPSAELLRQLRRLYRKARRHCLTIRSETPLYFAVGALLLWQKGRTQRAAKLLRKAEALALKFRNADGLLGIYRLALKMYPQESQEHQQYLARASGLLGILKALPRITFNQILEGHLGPAAWDYL
jgi:tetratricopeptide (TPR) repeat protein